MQSRQTFMAAMGGVDPGEEGYGEYDEARRRSAHPPAFVYALLNTRACARPSRRETSPWTGSEGRGAVPCTAPLDQGSPPPASSLQLWG